MLRPKHRFPYTVSLPLKVPTIALHSYQISNILRNNQVDENMIRRTNKKKNAFLIVKEDKLSN